MNREHTNGQAGAGANGAERYDTQGYAERAGYASEPETASGPNPLHLAHRALRGRYAIAIVLGLVFAIGGAMAAWNLTPEEYTSFAPIEVSDRGGIEILDADILSQSTARSNTTKLETLVNLARSSERVRDLAIERHGLKDLSPPWPSGYEGRRMLGQGMSVTRQPRTNLIYVRFNHEDPVIAQRACDALVLAFVDFYRETEGAGIQQRLQVLRQERTSRELTIRDKQREIDEILREYGTIADLDELYQASVNRLNGLRTTTEQLDLQLKRLQENPELAREGGGIDVGAIPLDKLATIDSALGDLTRTQESIELRIAEREQALGPNHPTMRALREQLDAVEDRITRKVADLRDRIARGEVEIDPIALGLPQLDPERLGEQIDLYRASIADAENRESRLFDALDRVRRLSDEIGFVRENLESVRSTIALIEIELAGNSDMQPVKIRESASPPEQDASKRLPLTAAALGGGVFGGFVLVGFVGLLDRRYRYVEEVSHSDKLPPLVGVIPKLNPKDGESIRFAKLAVHHVRNTLMLHHPTREGRARMFTVTSAVAGDGKTNLARALGLSFAESGYRTLLVDADFVGHGMTTDQDLDGREGLVEAISAESATSVAPALGPIEGLSILPAGSTLAAERLAREPLARALAELRREYEVMIVDTGPILGSLEAGFVSVEADAVLAVISRWSDNRLVNAMLDRLESLGVSRVWTVFNKAEPQDATQSVSQGSLTSRSMRREETGTRQGRARKRKDGMQLIDAMVTEDAEATSAAAGQHG